MSLSVQQKRTRFRQLHQHGMFVLPNPWDLGSLRQLEELGAQAIASSSAAFAWSQGLDDFQLARDTVLNHLRMLASATHLPVNADFESGFSDSLEGLAENIRLAIDTGIAGLSIEDRTGDDLYDHDTAVARIRTAKDTINSTGEEIMLIARSEGLLTKTADLEQTIKRLKDYALAGADVVYAPGIKDPNDIRALVQTVAPTPVNVLLMDHTMRVADLAKLGVRRVSTGSRLAVAARTAFEHAARSVLSHGTLPEK